MIRRNFHQTPENPFEEKAAKNVFQALPILRGGKKGVFQAFPAREPLKRAFLAGMDRGFSESVRRPVTEWCR